MFVMKIFLIQKHKVFNFFKKENDKLKISDEAIIIYTRTTGNPKGVVLTHGNIIADAMQYQKILSLTTILELFVSYLCFTTMDRLQHFLHLYTQVDLQL